MISSSGRKRDSLLFVYGTLRHCSTASMARWLASEAHHLGPARVRGRLYDLGRYPALRPARCARDWVIGDLYALRSNARTLRALDRYEGVRIGGAGAPFARMQTLVVPLHSSGRMRFACRVAWVYSYRFPISPGARVRSGDYRQRLLVASEFV